MKARLEAIEVLETKVAWDFTNRRSMERDPREPLHKLRDRRMAGRMERVELRAICVALRALRHACGGAS